METGMTVDEILEADSEIPLSKLKEKTGKFEVRPLRLFEEWLVTRGAFEGPWWLHIRRMWQENRDLTPELLAEIDFAYNHDQNIIFILMGPTGSGKSTVSVSTSKHLQLRVQELLSLPGKVHMFFTLDEMFRNIPNIAQGDIIILDEVVKQAGYGARTVRDAIFNVQENALRGNLNSFLVDSPTLKGFEQAAHILLDPFGIDYENKVTLVKVYSAYTLRPLGTAQIPRHSDPELDKRYNQLKKKHTSTTMKSSGIFSVQFDKDKLREDARRLLDECKKEFGDIELKRNYLDYMTRFSGIVGNTTYQKDVATYAWILTIIEQNVHRVKSSAITPDISLDNVDFSEGLFSAFVVAMQQFIKIHLKKPKKGTDRDVPAECAETYPHYLRARPPKTIMKLFSIKISKATVERRIERLDEFLSRKNGEIPQLVGHLYERVFCAFYEAEGSQVVQGGGSAPGAIDAIVDGQVWSLKCYHDQTHHTLKVPFSEISQGEKDYALQSNKKIGVSLLNPFWLKECHVIVEIQDFEKQGEVILRRPNIE